MPYEAYLDQNGILRARFFGNLSVEDWTTYMAEYEPFLDAVTEADPLHFLADVGQMGKVSAQARRVILDAFRNPDPRVGKTAMVGANRYMRVLTSFILKATGRDNIRLFETEEEALAWLEN